MEILLNLLINTIALMIATYILPGVHVASWTDALVAALVLGIVNAFVRPILIILTLPITLLTLGLFILVINTLLILLVAAIVPGFDVDGFWWAFLLSIVLWVINAVLHSLESTLRAA